jgi:PAS domain S-box-containing protein
MLNALEWLIDRTSSGVLLIGEDGHIVHASGQIEQTFGYPRRGVVGMHFDELVAEPFRRTLWARCGALLSDTTPRPHATIQRLPMVRRDGSSFAATIDVDLVKSNDLRLLAASFIDDPVIARSLEQFSTALEAAPTGMMLVDEHGTIVYVNSQTERLFRYPRHDLIGQKIERLVPTRAQPEHVALRDHFLQAPQTRAMGAGRDLYGLCRDGSEVPIEIGLNAVTLDGRRYVLSSIVDITERKRAEHALRQSEERHRELFSHSPVALLEQDFTDIRAYLNGLSLSAPADASAFFQERPDALEVAMDKAITLTANQRALSLFEAGSASELRGLSSFFVAQTLDWFRQAVTHLLAGDSYFGGETLVRTRKGNVRVVNKRVHVVTGHQESWSRLVVSFFDLTAHKQAEDRLRASLREKEVLLREIHHRVKNNLQIVSSLLNLKADAVTDPVMLQVFEDCRTRVHSLAILHEHLYASGDLSNVPFSAYVRTLVEQLRQSSGLPGQLISARIEADDVQLSINDAIPCGLIVNELVTNALKHAFPPGVRGLILVSLRKIAHGRLELTVSDDGVGLPRELQAGPRHSGSTGLDLVFTFAEQLGAEVELIRQVGTKIAVRFAPEGANGRAN